VRRGHFEALAPVCPRCLHGRGVTAPLRLAEIVEQSDGHVIHGVLHCSDPACWLEFPVIDAVPVIVPDPRAVIGAALEEVSARTDLPAAIEGLLDDVAGPGTRRLATRHHLSLYAEAHYADWSGLAPRAEMADLARAALAMTGGAGAPALDLGCAVGRATLELGACDEGPVLGGDLNLAMLRLAQRLIREGAATWPRRRCGLVHDQVTVRLPAGMEAAAARVDFWAFDALALPFPPGRFGGAVALNLVDCVAAPAQMLAELARSLAPGAGAALSSPYDWSEQATALEHWLGGHSARGPLAGESAAALRAALGPLGLVETGARDDLDWVLRLHDRARMTYRLDLIALARVAG